MNRQILAAILAAVMGLTLAACGQAAVRPEPTEPRSTSEPPSPRTTRHLTLSLDENYRIDADVSLPSRTELPVYTLQMIDFTPEELFAIFCPDNPEEISKVDPGAPGRTAYKKASGQEVSWEPYDMRLNYTADPETAYTPGPESETATLLYYYTREHPDAPPHDLSFLTAAELEQEAESLFQKLGMAFQPELLHFVTLSGQEVLDFQEEMYRDPFYTEMGTPFQLTGAEDTCYLEYIFSMDEIPIFGPMEHGVSYIDGVFPPIPVSASLLITEEGIQRFSMNYACTAVKGEDKPLLTPEEAAQALKEQYALEIHFGEIVFDRVYLQYIPVMEGEQFVLKPYWCFDSPDLSERINALTGEDISYGG